MPQLSPTSGLLIFLFVFFAFYTLFCTMNSVKTPLKINKTNSKNIKPVVFF